MIEIENLTFAYPNQPPVFEHFSWHAARGEAWAVIGPSGCGKTTLLYLIAGLRAPTGGMIRIHGAPVTRPRPETGLILQDHGLLPWATVEKNARLGLTIRSFYGPDGKHAPRGGARLSKAQEAERVAYWLRRLGIDALAGKYPSQLSGGQRQRAAIARTLVMQPDLLLMDEPFSALDVTTRTDLQNLTVELRGEANLTSVIVTHNIEEAVFLGTKILALGLPPNRNPQIIHNFRGKAVDYRNSLQFSAKCDELRAALEAVT
ncbi:MAG: ATP-binding cassette domain-containing protein [Anaerolineae bacterium]|nr:ATP-binding cassette domain-containing protein [Anaerolineae bacterium]